MISPALFDVVRCPDCRSALTPTTPPACTGCGRTFVADGYLDLRPSQPFREQTRYVDPALHADARHERITPPVLGSKIRNDMLNKFLAPGASDRVVDLGCGSGRALAWNADSGATLVGIDLSPYFAREAVDRWPLVLGDLRQLPLCTGAFNKAWSLDVLEHLSPRALEDMLAEANRVLADGGLLFVYSHVRKNSWIAVGVRAVNRLARLLERARLLDLRRERLRKSDHVNPLADHDELDRLLARTGFRLERITYYTPLIGSFVENVLVRMAERVLTSREARRVKDADAESAVRAARAAAQASVGRSGLLYRLLLVMTAVMKLDVWLFGRVKSGPFFALVRKTGPAQGTRAAGAAANERM